MRDNKSTIQTIAAELFGAEFEGELSRPPEGFGDYSTNVAMIAAKSMAKNPRELGEQLAKAIEKQLGDEFIKVEVAGPGFVNLTLRDDLLFEQAKTAVKVPKTLNGQKIVAEYSDPNPLKPLHAGHLYTTLVGDAIANLNSLGGGEVIRINYGGDVGLHVGKTMWAIIKELGGHEPEKLGKIPENNRSKWLGERYVEGNTAYESETEKQEIIEVNKKVYDLHKQKDHDSDFAKIYWTVRQWSYDYFEKLYAQLQVTKFDRVIPESEVAELGIKTVKEQLAKGVYEESDGAVVFRGEDHGLHTRVFINSAGLPTYEAKDVGLLLTKWQDYKFDKSLVITANEQSQYFEVMLKSVEQFMSEPVERSIHLSHGIVKLKGGVKMSSRKGNVVGALDILESAHQAQAKIYDEPDEQITLAAVKYAFLKNRIGGDIIYDPEESVNLQGNSGPYLQYALVRARSILSKVSAGEVKTDKLEPGERGLARKISEYPEIFERSLSEFAPHHICNYLYELAQRFNNFYENNRVVDDPRSDLRAELVSSYEKVLSHGLGVLGIPKLDKM